MAAVAAAAAVVVLRRSSLTYSSVNRIRSGVMTWNSSSYSSTTKSSSSPPPISDVFDSWCKKYRITYPSEQEKEKRLKVFEKNYEFVTHHNKNRPKYSRKVPLNDLADCTDEEFAVRYLAYRYCIKEQTISIWPPLPGPIWPFTTKPSPQHISDLFDTWCQKFGKKYTSEKEKEKRLKAFKKTYKYVVRHNRSDSSYKVALNPFAATTAKEIKHKRAAFNNFLNH